MANKAKYYLYRNLHTGGFSIKYKGLVVERDDYFLLRDIEFRVNENGRQRVQTEKRKNVHAFLVATGYKTFKSAPRTVDGLLQVTYNLYKNSTFVVASTGEPIYEAKYAVTTNGKVYVCV